MPDVISGIVMRGGEDEYLLIYQNTIIATIEDNDHVRLSSRLLVVKLI